MSLLPPENLPLSVLCVDDDPIILDGLKQFFGREQDFSVFVAGTGQDALDLVNQYQFDAIISDYSMPGMDGISLLKEIRAQRDQALFIMLTGRHLAQVAIETLNNGGNYYVQKGVDILAELPRVRDFIRNAVYTRRAEYAAVAARSLDGADTRYRSLVEKQPDLLCCFLPDGTATLGNEAYARAVGLAETAIPATNFLAAIPADERAGVQRHLAALTPDTPGAYIEHHLFDAGGRPRLYQWGYRGFFGENGGIAEYLAQGRDLSFVVKIGDILPGGAGAGAECSPVQGAVEAAAESGVVAPAELCTLGDSLELVQYPLFAIDTEGVVVAWNHAMAELTGVDAAAIIGEGGHSYALALYGEDRPMLIDYVLNPATDISRLPSVTREGDTIATEAETVAIRGRDVKLWSKGTTVHDAAGKTIAAVQSFIVSGQPPSPGAPEDAEHYIGGLSSIILKVAGGGVGSSLAGSIGTATGGYGVYATDRRLFVTHNPELDATRSTGMQFSEFLVNELFGTSVDTRPRSVAELEKSSIFAVKREEIASIELKTPRLLSGFLVIRTKDGGSFRIYVDHVTAFRHLERLLGLFSPDILRVGTAEMDSADLEWLDEVRTIELVGKLRADDPLAGISRAGSIPGKAVPFPGSPDFLPPLKSMAATWNELAESLRKIPYPVFGIDLSGRVIAWNDAIAKLTGITAQDMVGRGNYEYALPFYGTRRPMLIDYIGKQPDASPAGEPPVVSREGDTFIGSLENVTIRDRPMLLWGKGTGMYDSRGSVIGAVQSVLVSEQPSVKTIMGIYEEETYIGGISSITLKLPGDGLSGTIAGAIGSTTGGYGLYATDQRVIVVHNRNLDATRADGVQFGTFLMDELFGTTVDTRPRTIPELSRDRVFELWRKDIVSIEIKKPLLFSGYISFRTRSGEAFRIYIDHRKAFIHVDQLLRLFYPEILKIE